MKKLLLTWMLLQICLFAASDKYAPLPTKVLTAKTVFLTNETGISRFGDDLYQELKKWNHWQVVGDKEKADLILVLSQRDTVEGIITAGNAVSTGPTASASSVAASVKSSAWYLHVVDARSGEMLWTSRHTLGGRLWQSWGGVARALLADVQKRMK